MSASRMITSLIGAFGGGAVGRMMGGRMGGMIGSMAGSMLAGRMGSSSSGGGGIGDLLGGLMGGDDDRQRADVAAAAMPENDAMLLVRAMCNAAKADGRVDDAEIEAILARAGDLEPDDQVMLRAELGAPLDLESFIAEVPDHLAVDVYTASLLPIEVDTASEVEYLQRLGRGLGLSGSQVNEIHERLGLR